jgi:2Fe-2S ferredoxin
MPSMVFEGNALGPAVSVDAHEGGRLIDVCDDVRAPVAFSCRSASCGTCRVEVIAGHDLIEPAAQDERDILALFAAPASQRLACQAVARSGPGLIRLRCVIDDR